MWQIQVVMLGWSVPDDCPCNYSNQIEILQVYMIFKSFDHLSTLDVQYKLKTVFLCGFQ
jgi:hypothetical protein